MNLQLNLRPTSDWSKMKVKLSANHPNNHKENIHFCLSSSHWQLHVAACNYTPSSWKTAPIIHHCLPSCTHHSSVHHSLPYSINIIIIYWQVKYQATLLTTYYFFSCCHERGSGLREKPTAHFTIYFIFYLKTITTVNCLSTIYAPYWSQLRSSS